MSLKEEIEQFMNEFRGVVEYSMLDGEFTEVDDGYKGDSSQMGRKSLVDKDISFEVIAIQTGDYEGAESQDVYCVYKFSRNQDEVIVKIEGQYSSYNGDVFDRWFFAKAVPKQLFDYVKI